MSLLLVELRAACRQIARARRFSSLAVTLLALGLGATIAVFSLLHSIVLRPLPFREPEQLVGIQAINARKAIVQDGVSVSDYRDLAGRTRSLVATGAFRPNFASLTRPGEAPVRWVTGLVTPGLVETLGVAPALGRGFAPGDFSFSAPRTLLLSHAAWQRLFHGRRDVLGRELQLDDETYTVVGVMPADFREPAFVDAWLPFPDESPEYFARDSRFWTVIGRLAPGARVEQATAELATLAADLARQYPDTNRDWSLAAVGLQELRTAGLRPALLLLLAAVGLVLLVACLNLANLLLARAVGRLPELGVQLALGATARRLALRVLLENLLLALAGAAAGTALAAGVLHVAAHQLPPGLLPRTHELGLHGPAVAVAALLGVLSGVLCATLPAVQLLRVDVNALLKDGASRGATGSRLARFQGAIVVAQIALTVTVVAAALLLMKSLVHLQNVPPGFEPANLITLRLSPPPNRYETTPELARYYEDLLDAVERVPGVSGAAVNASTPLSGISLTYPAWVDGQGRDAAAARTAAYAPVSDGYFELMRQPLRQGRTFSAHDQAEGKPVAIVNEAFVRQALPEGRVLGRQVLLLPWMGETYREIVGVVADTRQDDLAAPPPPQVYVPQQQMPWFFSTLLIRLDRPGVLPALRAALREADPTLPFVPVPMVDNIAQTATQPRLLATLFSVFAGLAAGLSAFGIYASLRFTLSRRRREIGVRVALGAAPRQLIGWMFAHAGRLGAAGLALGLGGAVLLTFALRAQLYGVRPLDPGVFLLLPLLVGLVTFLAAWPIARRASHVPPAEALQQE